MLRIIAIIPARGGSKGLPGKNIRTLAGKPLIAWTIEAAKKVKSIDRVIVSTEDKKIAKVAGKYGAEVPFMRPAKLARDHSPTLSVLQHAVSWLKTHENYQPDVIVLLQPTSPLRDAGAIQKAITLLQKSKADSIVSLCPAEHSPYWMKVLKGNKMYPLLKNGKENSRRQDLPPVYRLNGAIYITRNKTLMKQNRILSKDVRAVFMNAESSVDIDTAFDFKIAEILLRERKNARG